MNKIKKNKTLIGCEFNLNLAHSADHHPDNHKNKHLHGHSYHIRLFFTGDVDETSGYVQDLDEILPITDKIKKSVEGKLMNDIPGMGHSMENLGNWLINEVKKYQISGLSKVEISRPTCKMFCIIEPN